MKKRSLFVATAMLLVAVLVATGATYAWFNTVQQATTTINMSVANGEALEIANQAESDTTEWKSALTQADFTTLTKWTDLSTNDDELGTFYTEDYGTGADANNIIGYSVDNGVAKAKIYFRSSKDAALKVRINLDTTGLSDNLAKALRIGVEGADETIYAVDAKTIDHAIGASATEGKGEVGSTQTALDFESQLLDVQTFGSLTSGYYYCDATFYFWVEGTECLNSDSAANLFANATLTFSQAQ